MNHRPYRGIINEKWVYGWLQYVPKERAVSGKFDIAYISNLDKNDCFQTFVVIPETVGQSTGLKNKSDVEVYFSDILRWNYKDWVIVWSTTLSGIQLQPLANYLARQKDTTIKRLFGPSFGIGQAKYSEKIGTIHDHLLAKGAKP